MSANVCVGRAGNERDRNKVSHGAAHDPYRIANHTYNPVLWTTLYAAAEAVAANKTASSSSSRERGGFNERA